MKFYTKQNQFYCGVDLHADAMYVCILDATGEIVLHKNIPTRPKSFLRLIRPCCERTNRPESPAPYPSPTLTGEIELRICSSLIPPVLNGPAQGYARDSRRQGEPGRKDRPLHLRASISVWCGTEFATRGESQAGNWWFSKISRLSKNGKSYSFALTDFFTIDGRGPDKC